MLADTKNTIWTWKWTSYETFKPFVYQSTYKFISINISLLYIFPQSSRREISEHLHCWRTPGMLSHTVDFNLDYRGKCSYVIQPESTASLHEQTPPKRITENPSLISWSIQVQCQRKVAQRTRLPEDGQSVHSSMFTGVVFGYLCIKLLFLI